MGFVQYIPSLSDCGTEVELEVSSSNDKHLLWLAGSERWELVVRGVDIAPI